GRHFYHVDANWVMAAQCYLTAIKLAENRDARHTIRRCCAGTHRADFVVVSPIYAASGSGHDSSGRYRGCGRTWYRGCSSGASCPHGVGYGRSEAPKLEFGMSKARGQNSPGLGTATTEPQRYSRSIEYPASYNHTGTTHLRLR